jgi:hypothetical protein
VDKSGPLFALARARQPGLHAPAQVLTVDALRGREYARWQAPAGPNELEADEHPVPLDEVRDDERMERAVGYEQERRPHRFAESQVSQFEGQGCGRVGYFGGNASASTASR